MQQPPERTRYLEWRQHALAEAESEAEAEEEAKR